MKASEFLERRSKLFWVTSGLILIIGLGIADHFTGYEVSLSLFYIVPIFLVVWYTDGRRGLLLSSVSAVAWLVADYSAGLTYSNPSIFVWNTVLRVGFYFVVTWLVSALKKTYKANLELARTDFVTGATSVRYFYELAQMEINRAQRYKRPFTLAYIDLDNFKDINDRLGHSTGDRVLRAVTDIIRRQVRPTDTLARLGGDEFGLLMPETAEDAAKTVINRIHSSLVEEMLRNSWVVTFSVGVVTFIEVPKTVDDIVKTADSAMYCVKVASKNGVYYQIHGSR
jgi:diguanylate cyclase (GGDEF)-like protein